MLRRDSERPETPAQRYSQQEQTRGLTNKKRYDASSPAQPHPQSFYDPPLERRTELYYAASTVSEGTILPEDSVSQINSVRNSSGGPSGLNRPLGPGSTSQNHILPALEHSGRGEEVGEYSWFGSLPPGNEGGYRRINVPRPEVPGALEGRQIITRELGVPVSQRQQIDNGRSFIVLPRPAREVEPLLLRDESRGEGELSSLIEEAGQIAGYEAQDFRGYYEVQPEQYPGQYLPRPSEGDDEATIYPPTKYEKSSISNVPALAKIKWNWRRWFYDSSTLEEQLERYNRGERVQQYPWACWALSAVMVAVFIWELFEMKAATGSYIATTPVFNPMIGPSGTVLIHSGARFVGCMKFVPGISDLSWPCLNSSNTAILTLENVTCTMSDICGFGGFPANAPNQWFRLFVPTFLHAGGIHLLFNLAAQCLVSAVVEKQMGTPKFLVLYFAAGIFGFLFGANFALPGLPSVGASGAIFGTEASLIVDLLAHWHLVKTPSRQLTWLVLEIVVGLALGLVPGIDNFAHIGGFLMGLFFSLLFLPIVHVTRRHRHVFIALRCLAIPTILVLYTILFRHFYSESTSPASWLRFLSCWPTAANNQCLGNGLGAATVSSSTLIPLAVFLSSLIFPHLLSSVGVTEPLKK